MSVDPMHTRIQELVQTQPVFLFTKSYCPHCIASRRTLESLEIKYGFLDLDRVKEGGALQNALEQLTGQRTVPNIYIGGKSIGGNSDLEELKYADQLMDLVLKAEVLAKADAQPKPGAQPEGHTDL